MQAHHAPHSLPSRKRLRRDAGPERQPIATTEPTAHEVVAVDGPAQSGRAELLHRVGVVLVFPGGKVRVLPWRAGGPLSDEVSKELVRLDTSDPSTWGGRGFTLKVSPRELPWRDMLAGVLPIAAS